MLFVLSNRAAQRWLNNWVTWWHMLSQTTCTHTGIMTGYIQCMRRKSPCIHTKSNIWSCYYDFKGSTTRKDQEWSSRSFSPTVNMKLLLFLCQYCTWSLFDVFLMYMHINELHRKSCGYEHKICWLLPKYYYYNPKQKWLFSSCQPVIYYMSAIIHSCPGNRFHVNNCPHT